MREPYTPTIAVAAGKGGTGKTLIATSLALALNDQYPGKVQLLDCDVEEPNAHLLLRPMIDRTESVSILIPRVDKLKCDRCGICAQVCQFSAIAVIRDAILTFPELCCGCGACIYACPRLAIDEETRQIGVASSGRTDEGIRFHMGKANVGVQRSGPVIKATKEYIDPGMISILDAPPGTACPMQGTIEASDYCILVTEPTPFGLSDLRAAVDTCKALSVPCGIIVNRDGPTDPGIQEYCRQQDIPLLLRIPEIRKVAEAYSRGITLTAAMPEWKDPFLNTYDAIVQNISTPTGGDEYARV
ncbi:MAG TPA: ATP-binding protein [Armatimonadota bacterium]|nr:ATP-binding protein [Armatimonadota bacterium]